MPVAKAPSAVTSVSATATWPLPSVTIGVDMRLTYSFGKRLINRLLWNRNFAQNESIIWRLALNFLKRFQEICHYRIGNTKVALKTLRKILIGNDSDMEKLIMTAF